MKTSFPLMFLCLLSSIIAAGQKRYFTERPIYFDLIKEYIYVQDVQDSSIRTGRGDVETHYVKVFNITTKGSFQFIVLDSATQTTIKGQYKAADEVSKPFNYKRDGLRVVTWGNGIAEYHYRPKKTGTWLYYDRTGLLTRKETF